MEHSSVNRMVRAPSDTTMRLPCKLTPCSNSDMQRQGEVLKL